VKLLQLVFGDQWQEFYSDITRRNTYYQDSYIFIIRWQNFKILEINGGNRHRWKKRVTKRAAEL